MSINVSHVISKSLLLLCLCGYVQMLHAIPDDQDLVALTCPLVITEVTSTIVVGACDTAVKNRSWQTCTIADLLVQCAQEKPQFRNRCIAKVTNTLVELGVIDGKEKGDIQLCADPSDSERSDIHHQTIEKK